MARGLFILAIAAHPLLAEQKSEIAQALLAPAHSCTFCQKENHGPVSKQVSFLIWQSKEWGLEFASKSLIASDPASSYQTFKEHLYIPDFSWSPGFKVDFSFRLPRDNWDLDSRWTFYHGDCTNLKKHFGSQIEATGVGIVPLWHYPFIEFSSPTSAPLRFMKASGNWRLYFNSLDLNLGREFTPMSSLIFRMNLGAKGSWLRQLYHAEYGDGTIIVGTIRRPPAQHFRYISSQMAFKSYSWGLGPRGGLESKWKIGRGFSLAAGAAMSLLSSFFDLRTNFSDRLHNIDDNNKPVNNDLLLKEHTWELTPVFEGNLGLDWGTCFGRKENPFYLGMTFAYEVQYWWSQNHLQRNYAFQAPGNMWDMRGDLQMHGLTASIRSDF